jgi:glycosyltransferase involved in cell wall biosynthesis
MSVKGIVFVEPECGGHQADYLDHLITYWKQSRLSVSLTFVIHPDLASDVAKAQSGIERSDQLRVIKISEEEISNCTHKQQWVRAFARWRLMMRNLEMDGADHGHFLTLDYLQLPLALQLPVPRGRTLSGILFRPSIHYRTLRHYSSTLWERLRDARKQILYRAMLRHRALRVVFSLDEYFPEYAGTHIGANAAVMALPDPALFPESRSVGDDSGMVEPRCRRLCFLLFGFLAARKGVIQTLLAARLLNEKVARRVRLVLAGRIDPKIATDVQQLIVHLRRERPELELEVDDRYLSKEELALKVRTADVILAPYQRFVGSSGVLYWAASAGKPIITQSYGLLGELVSRHRLGMTIEARSPTVIAGAIAQCVEIGVEEIADVREMVRFVDGHTTRAFAAMLFRGMCSTGDRVDRGEPCADAGR